jgi:hypothetical protein
MYLSKDWTASSYVRAILPDNGGHVGFHDRCGCWYNRVSKLFFSELGFCENGSVFSLIDQPQKSPGFSPGLSLEKK